MAVTRTDEVFVQNGFLVGDQVLGDVPADPAAALDGRLYQTKSAPVPVLGALE
jgi:hypothetical protein